VKKVHLICIITTLAIITCLVVAAPLLVEKILVINLSLRKADAIVLLAGAYKERTPVVARLYHEGNASRIILTDDGVLSSWSESYQKNLCHVDWAEELLVSLGVPRHAIIKLPYRGSGTVYEALTTRTAVLQYGFKSLILATDDYHTRRALLTFSLVFRDQSVKLGTFPVASGAPRHMRSAHVQELVKLAYYLSRFTLFRNFGRSLGGFVI
jgi:uncharacterized SAM-binding protein YcdF (DUF218 family)